MTTPAQSTPLPLRRRAIVPALPRGTARFLAGVLVLAFAYVVAAKLGQLLRYTASVSAIWPPAGVGIAALYLWGLRWWPGILLGELVVNAELLGALPAGSLAGQQAGNMLEVLLGAALLRRACGPRAALDRVEQVGGLFATVAVAAAVSASFGTVSMLAGDAVEPGEALRFWRTWGLGDASGALVVVAVALAWSHAPRRQLRHLWSLNGALMVSTVVVLGVIALTVEDPVSYAVFPALIWAAFRFGPPGATLAVAITAALAIGLTAADAGPFSKQPIDHRTIGTQLYIATAALTTLLLAAVVSERARTAAALTAARLREGERAGEERRRIARDLHDSLSQTLFSTLLHTRRAQRALAAPAGRDDDPLARSLEAIADLTRGAQSETRTLIAELGRDALAAGLVPALARLAADVSAREGVAVQLVAPNAEPGLAAAVEAQVFGIAREALANAVRHAGAPTVRVRLEASSGGLVLEVADTGRGFDPVLSRPGHFGLDSMRSRAGEIGARLTIDSAPGKGTVVRVEVPGD
jgi:signal transduction histidine kinase